MNGKIEKRIDTINKKAINQICSRIAFDFIEGNGPLELVLAGFEHGQDLRLYVEASS